MSREYAMSRVKDALEKSNGNHLKAQRLLLQWMEKDQSLLFGLVTPHLQSIITHAINHVSAPAGAKKVPAGTRKVAVPKQTGEFGGAMLGALKGGADSVAFGQPDGAVSRPGATSQKHIDTMRALAAAQKGGGTKGKKK